ncbi:MAG TPA: D-aminoacyl-tRNA deacylase [Acidimicrobiia bacterium]
MKVVLQRVSRAAVTVARKEVGSIGPGLCLLVGVGPDDTGADIAVAVDKIAGLRVFPDTSGQMNRSVVDTGGGVLVISQFTLFADVSRGRRPSFSDAGPPETARELIDEMVGGLRDRGIEVATGRFGAKMEVELVNDGPVTLMLEIRNGKVL